jgi:hypothetical protein
MFYKSIEIYATYANRPKLFVTANRTVLKTDTTGADYTVPNCSAGDLGSSLLQQLIVHVCLTLEMETCQQFDGCVCLVPGPIIDLRVVNRTSNQLTIEWGRPVETNGRLRGYRLSVSGS